MTSRSESLVATWKNRAEYKGYDKSKGSSFNSWRAIIHTAKGKDIGFPEEWKEYRVFMDEVQGEWEQGKIVVRIDTAKPHSAINSHWSEKGTENIGKLIKLEYEGETKTLLEWSKQYNLPYQGVRQRYFKGKCATAHEVLFGKARVVKEKKERDWLFRTARMFGAYKLSDKKKGFNFDLTLEFMRDEVRKECVYCGCDERVGLDRVDNSLGHVIGNVVPCCYECNCARMNNFTHAEMFIIGTAIKEVRRIRNENK